jgi:signal transduction histidine kinase
VQRISPAEQLELEPQPLVRRAQEIALPRQSEDRLSVVTRVSNRGPRIPPERMATLWKPFARRDGSDGGLGLGLYIVAQIALAHGATCDVDSTDEVTTFTIRWPRTPVDEVPALQPHEAPRAC